MSTITIDNHAFRPRLPGFLKQSVPSGPQFNAVQSAIRQFKLNTVCEEAKCPNRTHCYERGTLTFQILGEVCTRSCGFCAEKFGRPSHPPDPNEPQCVVQAAKRLNLRHVVITSPARDDLADDGATQFARVVDLFRAELPHVTVEILTSDMRGRAKSLQILFDCKPHAFNHNIETVRRLTPKVRSKATYDRTLSVLKKAKEANLVTKSGLMLGHGETRDEIVETLRDLRAVNCDFLTIGQYLPPSARHLPLLKIYPPDEFDRLRQEGLQYGFLDVSSGPLVRSSYYADKAASLLTV